MLAFERYPMWSRLNPDRSTTVYYYYDSYTWVVAALALAWVTWFLVSRYMRARALRRRPRRRRDRRLEQVVKVKRELSTRYLRPGFSANIHAVGVGLLGGNGYCIQVFIRDLNQELWAGSGAAALPPDYRGVPVVPVIMPAAGFLSGAGVSPPAPHAQYPEGIREHRDVIIGGISGANTNLTGQSGTIGYFCTRKSRLPRRREIHLLSNSHVFADLRKAKVDDGDLITQPSPGEPAGNRPIAALVNYSALKFDGGTDDPNHVDAAIARLWDSHQHTPVIPLIGAVKGYVPQKDVELGEVARKFGRTTGYTEGRVFSIHLDIWIRYDRTGQSAFFHDQFLVEPSAPNFNRFVAKGDSGSMLMDAGQNAVGLIFAGMFDTPQPPSTPEPDDDADQPRRLENYGVANPISEVLDRLKIDLLI